MQLIRTSATTILAAEDRSVLGTNSASMVQYLEASVNSASTSCPLRNSACAPLFNKGYAIAEQIFERRKRARGHDVRLAASKLCDKVLDPHGMDLSRRAGARDGFAQERRLLRIALDQMDTRARRAASAQAIDQPGKSAARARDRPRCLASGARSRSWSESATWRVQTPGSSRRDQIGRCLPLQQQRRRSDRAAPLFHVKQVAQRRRDARDRRDRSRLARGRYHCGRSGAAFARRAAPQMRRQKRQRRRRDAVDAPGLADGARPSRAQASAALRWKARQRRHNRDRSGSTRASSRRKAATSAVWRSR